MCMHYIHAYDKKLGGELFGGQMGAAEVESRGEGRLVEHKYERSIM